MKPLDIEAAKKRCEAATPGPWVSANSFGKRSIFQEGHEWDIHGVATHYGVEREEDGEFIAAARTDLPQALAELAEARAEIARASEDAAVTLVSLALPHCRCGALATYETKHRSGPNPPPCSTVAPFDPEVDESNTADSWAKKLPQAEAVRTFVAAYELFHYEAQDLPQSSDENVILRKELAKWTRRAIDSLARAKIAESVTSEGDRDITAALWALHDAVQREWAAGDLAAATGVVAAMDRARALLGVAPPEGAR